MTTQGSKRLISETFWKSLFAANSIAVIGANNVAGSWGCDAFRTGLLSAKVDPTRKIYPVNPNEKEILGVRAFKTVLEIPDPVELAVVVVRAEIVPAVLRQCAEKKVKAAVIISAGFAEVGEAGAKLQSELVETATAAGMHFVGPNCVGHADIHTQVASAMVVQRVKPGPLALITQSGTLGASIVMTAAGHGIGMSKFISTGNEADLRLEDYLEFLAEDGDTRVIGLYIEGLREGRRFFELAKKITREKPIIAIKTGTTIGSSRAARSHTGALAGADSVYTAAFKQSGVIRVEDEEELCDVTTALLSMPLPRGNGVGILTMGGGFGVVTAEACEKEGLTIAPLEPHTIEAMNAILPPRWSHANPVDLVGIKTMGDNEIVPTCLRLLIEDKNIDVVVSLLPPVNFFPGAGSFTPEQIERMQKEYLKQMNYLNGLVKQSGKPLILLRHFNQPAIGNTGLSVQPGESLPEYSNPRRVAKVLGLLAKYREYLE
jgi:acetyl-CoA synthetase (ADP-forming)